MSCEGEVVCTTPCIEHIASAYPCPRKYTASGAIQHDIITNNIGILFGKELIFSSVKRSFLAEFNSSLTENGMCSGTSPVISLSASISENIVSDVATFHYINMQDEVALIQRTKYIMEFSANGPEQIWTNSGKPSLYGKLVVNNGIMRVDKEFVLLRNGTTETLHKKSYNTQFADVFVLPTPPPEDAGSIPFSYYNAYGACNQSTSPTDKVALDGGRDMFFPEWARNMPSCPVWEEDAKNRFNVCAGKEYPEKYMYTPRINLLPTGSFARHPEYGDMYSFLTAIGPETKITNHMDNGNPVDFLSKAVTTALKTNTVFYPISIY